MKVLRVTLLFVLAIVSRLSTGASVERYESARPAQTAVVNLLDTLTELRTRDADRGAEYEQDDGYEYEDEEEDNFSGDLEFELPQVAMSSKPKDPSVILNAEVTPRRSKGQGKRKGKGQKRNPCLKKYKNLCIHGTCQYLKDLRAPSCICQVGYAGDRCHFLSLPVIKEEGGYSRTTALAVVAVVLSFLCLTIIGLLLALRFHKRGAYEVESEEKVKLGPHN